MSRHAATWPQYTEGRLFLSSVYAWEATGDAPMHNAWSDPWCQGVAEESYIYAANYSCAVFQSSFSQDWCITAACATEPWYQPWHANVFRTNFLSYSSVVLKTLTNQHSCRNVQIWPHNISLIFAFSSSQVLLLWLKMQLFYRCNKCWGTLLLSEYSAAGIHWPYIIIAACGARTATRPRPGIDLLSQLGTDSAARGLREIPGMWEKERQMEMERVRITFGKLHVSHSMFNKHTSARLSRTWVWSNIIVSTLSRSKSAWVHTCTFFIYSSMAQSLSRALFTNMYFSRIAKSGDIYENFQLISWSLRLAGWMLLYKWRKPLVLSIPSKSSRVNQFSEWDNLMSFDQYWLTSSPYTRLEWRRPAPKCMVQPTTPEQVWQWRDWQQSAGIRSRPCLRRCLEYFSSLTESARSMYCTCTSWLRTAMSKPRRGSAHVE